MNQLNIKDYTQILQYYNLPIPSNNKTIKKNASKILSQKLCRCIKKVDPINKSKSIAICTKSIFNKKGLSRGKFKCYKNAMVQFKKNKTFKYIK